MKRIMYEVKCRDCGITFHLDVLDTDITKYRAGAYVQVAFPYLTSAERELLISGTCGTCFDKMFPED